MSHAFPTFFSADRLLPLRATQLNSTQHLRVKSDASLAPQHFLDQDYAHFPVNSWSAALSSCHTHHLCLRAWMSREQFIIVVQRENSTHTAWVQIFPICCYSTGDPGHILYLTSLPFNSITYKMEIIKINTYLIGFPWWLSSKESTYSAGDTRGTSGRLGRSPG